MKQSYIERKRALAKAMDMEQEDVRCQDMSNLWAIKLDGTRELCVIAPDAEAAAMRERAEGVVDERVEAYRAIPAPHMLNAARLGEAERIAAAIRALPITD